MSEPPSRLEARSRDRLFGGDDGRHGKPSCEGFSVRSVASQLHTEARITRPSKSSRGKQELLVKGTHKLPFVQDLPSPATGTPSLFRTAKIFSLLKSDQRFATGWDRCEAAATGSIAARRLVWSVTRSPSSNEPGVGNCTTESPFFAATPSEVLEQKFTELLGQLRFDDEVLGWVQESLQRATPMSGAITKKRLSGSRANTSDWRSNQHDVSRQTRWASRQHVLRPDVGPMARRAESLPARD